MRYHSFFLLIILFSAGIHFSYGQSRIKLLNMEDKARNYLKKNRFHEALPIYKKLDSIKPETPDYMYPIGICLVNMEQNVKALPYFKACLQNPDKYPIGLYYYSAKAYHLSHRFEEAITNYKKYKKKFIETTGEKEHKKLEQLDQKIKQCRNGIELKKDPLDLKLNPISPVINTKYPEYGPVINAEEDMLIFTSERPNTTGGKKDPYDGEYYEDIYISRKDSNGNWQEPEKISPKINTEGHDASINLTPDGQKLLFYRYNKGTFISSGSGNLYISERKGKKWGKPKKLPEPINSKAWEPSASFSANGQKIYFASNREGGHGGTDIYVSEKQPDGSWGKPENLGENINTELREDAPYIHADGTTLYFSSKGHKTMGGFDIFVSKKNSQTNTWEKPENVGYPISTAHDDLHFSWSADGTKAFFSSKRHDGQGEEDIYYATVYEEKSRLVVMKGLVTDSLNKAPLKAQIKVRNQKTNELVGIFKSNKATGKYLMILPEGKDYEFTITSENHQTCSEDIHIPNKDSYREIKKNIQLKCEDNTK